MSTQVFVFGHSLSAQTKAWLEQQHDGSFKVFKAFTQVDMQANVLEDIARVLRKLRRQGADFTGHSTTYISLPGLSVATAVVVAALFGALGPVLRVLVLIQQTDAAGNVFYAPSPELPYIDLHGVRNGLGRGLRSLDDAAA